MGLRTTVVLIVLCLVSAGCGGFKQVKETSEDIIWSEEIELEGESELNPAQQRMARIVYPVDTRLQSLIQAVRTMEPKKGEGAGFSDLLSEFPWVAGVAVVSPEGEIRASQPENDQGLPRLEKVVRQASQWDDRDLHALYGKSRFGMDAVLLEALYSSGRHTGYLVVSFDFSSLMERTSRRKELVAVSQGEVLWAGGYDGASKRLAQLEWDQRLESRAWGRCRVKEGMFLWMARYIGEEPFFYAVKIQGDS